MSSANLWMVWGGYFEKRVLSVEIIDFKRTSFVGKRLMCGIFRGIAFSLFVDCVDSVAT